MNRAQQSPCARPGSSHAGAVDSEAFATPRGSYQSAGRGARVMVDVATGPTFTFRSALPPGMTAAEARQRCAEALAALAGEAEA